MDDITNDESDHPEGAAPTEAPTTGEAPPSETTDQRHLRRSRTTKVFGGVAGGVAERFDVDANIVRVAFVVLALLWGLGIAVYLAMWVLIPRAAGSDEVVAPVEPDDRHRLHWLRFAVPAALVVLMLVVITGLHRMSAWSHGLTALWLVFLVVLAVAALFTPARRLTLRRLLALGFLSFVSVLILATGAFFILVNVTGVPLRGGSGVRDWHPVNQAEVQRYYHGAIGLTRVNLQEVRFAPGTWRVNATEGVGQLVVIVPPNVSVDLITHVGIGGVFNETYPTSPTAPRATPSRARLVLNLQVGIGKIRVERPRG